MEHMIKKPHISPREVKIFCLQCGMFPNMKNMLFCWELLILQRLTLNQIFYLQNNQ